MRGIPRHFNTKQDIINSLAVDKEATKEKLKGLLDGRFAWFPVAALKDGESGVSDSTHKVVSVGTEDGNEELWQYELRNDPAAWIYQIGLTVKEAQKLLEG